MNNRTLLSKAAVDTATLGTGGKMNPEQSKKFITFMKDYSPLLGSFSPSFVSGSASLITAASAFCAAFKASRFLLDNFFPAF